MSKSSTHFMMEHSAFSTKTTNISKFYPCENELIPGLPNDMALECLLRVPITSHPTLRMVSHRWMSTVSHPSFYSLRCRAATAEHLVFLVQPLSPLPLPPPPQEKIEDLGEKECATTQGPLMYNLSVYNTTSQEWRNLADITIPTFAQCIALPNVGKVIVLVLGGWDPETLEPVSRVLILDLAAGTWKEGSPMPTARSFFACAAAGPATVYVAGGQDGQKNALRSAEAYDVDTDQWRALPPMAEERDESHGLFLTDDLKFWVISGYGTESQGRFRSDAEVYDPQTNSWSVVDGVWPYHGHTPKTTAVVTTECQRRWWYVANGEPKEFDFDEKVWKTINLGQIPKCLSGLSSISLVDVGSGRIMVMGNGEKCGQECKEGSCGGDGVFMLETRNEDTISNNKDNNKGGQVNWCWKHVHSPSRFLGFPFSASHLLM